MELVERREEVLGSVIEIKVPKANSSILPLCFDELHRIDDTYSRFKANSALSKLNANLGVWQDVSEELLFLVSKAEHFHTQTDGNFDITLKGALDNLGYDSKYSFKQKDLQINPPSVSNQRGIFIDSSKQMILLTKEIELGGLGKGYAQDQVAKILESNGVFHYYVNAGGDIYAKRGISDAQGGNDPWVIILEHPDDPTLAIGTIELDCKSLAASAPNKRRWGNSHHLLNAKTLLPQMDVKAIFVLAKTGIEADAYATALFTAGFARGIELSKKLPVEVLMASSQNKMFMSSGFNATLFDK